MGNTGSSIGDLFYPDNPARRRRVQQLSDEIFALRTEFEQLKDRRNDVFLRIRPKMDAILRERGFRTSAELEAHVMSILNGEQLRRYQNMRQRLDRMDRAEGIVWDMIGIVSVSSGIVVGIGFVAGIITGAAAMAALAVVGVIIAVVVVILAIFGVVVGAIQRAQLRDGIRDLWFDRAEVFLAVEQMRVIAQWALVVEIWVDSPNMTPEILDELLTNTLDKDWNYWTMSRVDQVLLQRDHQNSAWRNEDPRRGQRQTLASETKDLNKSVQASEQSPSYLRPLRADQLVSQDFTKLWLTPRDGGSTHLMTFHSQISTHAQESFATDQDGDEWIITGKPANESNITLENTLFDFRCFAKRVTLLNHWVNIYASSTT